MTMSIEAQNVLSMIRQAEIGGSQSAPTSMAEGSGGAKASFSSDLTEALRSVNELQLTSAQNKIDFEASSEASLTDVLVDSQRASVAFEATLQIRNKVLKAYQDVMSLPV